MKRSRTIWLTLRITSLCAVVAVGALITAGCGGSGGSTSVISTASANTPSNALIVTLQESDNLSSSSEGITYTLSIRNNTTSSISIPSYVDNGGKNHPAWTLALIQPNNATATPFGNNPITTTIAIAPNQTYTDQLIAGGQYYTTTGTYTANAQLTYATGETLTIGPVTLNVSD